MRLQDVFTAVIFTLFLPLSGAAQQTPVGRQPDTAVLRLFDPGKLLLWQRYYRGTIDGVHVVEFSLAADGEVCQGYLRYPKSRTRIRLKGSVVKNQLRLVEFDAGNTPCGTWQGEIKNGNLEVEWRSMDQASGAFAETKESLHPLQTPTLNDRQPRFIRYTGQWQGRKATLVIAQSYGEQIAGALFLARTDRVYKLHGRMEADSLLALRTIEPLSRSAIRLDGVFQPDTDLRLMWNGAGERGEFTLKPAGSFPVASDVWADFQSSRDLLYPVTTCPECNKWFDKKRAAWRRRFSTDEQTATAAERNLYQASGWVDIVCWEDQWISGFLFLTAPGDSIPAGHAFSFDLQKKNVLTEEALFKTGAEWEAFLTNRAAVTWKKWPRAATDKSFEAWIRSGGFPLRVPTSGGLVVSTSFHPVYGRNQVLIPYSELKPFVANKRLLKRLPTE
ncbi:MAG: hypothetical protein SFV52_13625 [Saprospiraceae bacterium]|nr:hypothetical protein [Saprospiraceae bacterium]